ncbi:DUF3459 domain-containing protein [Streptomyces sp. H27-C3]|uniref:DUF3459 domain-containing protein n=1 Tax=Streptomyces sp. H27-C3 TaxID=3046305 RepID=UPI0024B9727F|nr:DUF3459 domain-containing protein [Streptomyces sp. H27-C3]MDJ0466447.1 DUF3459 domain-containing protein [Streptomyces sp. H27-C3]
MHLHRRALAVRRRQVAGLGEELTWVDAGPGTVCFDRAGGFRCLVNLGDAPVDLSEAAEILLSSVALPPAGAGASAGCPLVPPCG